MVVGLGESLSDLVEFLVVVEDNILTMPNLMTAVHSCLACYYLFNIAYPSKVKIMALFLEEAYKIKSSSKVPLHLEGLLNSISNISVDIKNIFVKVKKLHQA